MPSVSYWDGRHEAPQLLTVYDGTDEYAGVPELFKGRNGLSVLTSATNADPLYIAHRGGSACWPEGTMQAYVNAVQAYGVACVEIPVHRSRDGVFVVCHDADTLDATGQNHVIADTDWSVLSQLTVKADDTIYPAQPARPLAPLVEVLDAFVGHALIFIEDKTYSNYIALLDLMDTYPSATDAFVWKMYGESTDMQVQIPSQRGYKTWGYFFTGPSMNNYAADAVRFDYAGVDMNSTLAEWATIEATPVPTIGHIIDTPGQRDLVLNHGVIAVMTANIIDAMPRP